MASTWMGRPNSNATPIYRDLVRLSCLVTLAFTSSLAVDAFNPIKFACLVLGVFYIYVRYWRFIFRALVSSKKLITVSFGFLTHSLLILVFNSYSLSERLFGIQGRFFGFITIWSLFLLGLVTYLVAKYMKFSLNLVFGYLLTTNVIVAVVFFIQKFGIAFTNFKNEYAVLPSTLGNPNFLAAFVAASSFSGIFYLVSLRRQFAWNYLLAIISILASLSIATLSRSLQGPLGVVLGTFCLVFLTLITLRPKLAVGVATSILILSIPFIQGLFGGGIFGDRLGQTTLAVRSMYWKIAARMGMESPFFGYGFDTYLDNFRKYRSVDEVKIYGTGVVSDSPHNVFLDFFVAGGFPYLFWTLAGSVYVMWAALKTLKRLRWGDEHRTALTFLFTIWLVFTTVALINPFQLAVSIWNCLLGFLIVGLYHQFLGDGTKTVSMSKISNPKKSYAKIPLVASLVIFANPVFAVLPLSTDIRFRSAIEDSNYNSLRSVSMDWPFSGFRVAAISQSILDSSLSISSTPDSKIVKQQQVMIMNAIADAQRASKINPESWDLWRFLFFNHPDPRVRNESRQNLIRIDPQDSAWSFSGQ